MKRTWVGVVVIVALVGGVLLAKSMKSPPASASTVSATGATSSQMGPQVLLFADPREAGQSCGCGEIFRTVRVAGARGVRIREVHPERERDLVRQYRVTVEPTVLFVDATGGEVSRREGESGQTIAALRADLDRLAEGQR